MKTKLKKLWDKSYKDVLAVLAVTFLVTMWLFYFWDLQSMDWNVPISYAYGDDMSLLQSIRMVQDTGWNMGTDRISATDVYYCNSNEFIAGLHNADIFMIRIFSLFTDNVGVIANLVMISIFYLVAYVTYIVMRLLNIKRWVSVGGSVIFAFLPFMFMRVINHTQLASYYFVPLAVLMAIWVYEDEKFMLPRKDFFKYKKNIGGLVMAFLIASQGIGYWQIFACFFILVTTVTRFLRSKNVNVIKSGATAIMAIVAAVVIHIIPEIFTMLTMNSEELIVRGRSFADGEMYSLKIAQLLLPVNGHGIDILDKLISVYNSEMPLVNENRTAYIGAMGIIGFMFLIFWTFTNRKSDTVAGRRLACLSDMNMCALLLACIGGFGSIVYIGGFSMLRCYNRISVFIAFICILATCILLNYASINIKKKNMKYAFAAGGVLFMMFVVWEQYPAVKINYASVSEKWYSDESFIESVENVMDEDDNIFQLPYVRYPESPVINNMMHMSHLRGYVHSENLRWSYATIAGSKNDTWCAETASMEDTDEMIDELLENGFEGVYIDRNGYEEDDWKKLEAEFKAALGTEPIVSQNGVLSFFKIK